MNITIHDEIQNLRTEINNIEIINPSTGNVSKDSPYHTSHSDFMYQRNDTNNYNRRSYIIQNQHFTYQRKGSTNELELMMQTLQQQVNEMQIQTNSLSSGGGGDPDTGTM